MKIRVNPHNVEIVKEQTEPINELEIKVSKCEFEFDEAITNDFVKEAYFTLNGETYKKIIQNNECDYPSEVLAEKGTLEIGVVAFKVENGEEIVRYNPSPDYFESWVGSLKDAENSEPITPSEMEQFEQELQEGLNQVANVDIDAEKVNNVAVVTITNRYGEEKSVSIYDGEKGDKGDKGDRGEQGIQGIQGIQGVQGEKGDTGNGINYINLTNTSGGVKTYTIHYTDGNTYDYNVTDGEVTREELQEEVDRLNMVYNALPSQEVTGESITINGTAKVPFRKILLKGNTSQEGTPTPDTPIAVNVVSGNNTIIVSNSDNTQSQSYSISLGNIELCKIGDYQDRIYKDNGKWYIEKQIGKVVFNGSENWSKFSVAQGNLFRNNSVGVSIINIALISNYFIGVNSSDSRHDGTIYYNYNATIEHTTFDILSNKFSSAEDFKDWLSTHNTIVYYVLATPTIIEITDSTLINQLNNLEKAYSYDEQTNISQVNNDLPFIITAEAILSLKNILNI